MFRSLFSSNQLLKKALVITSRNASSMPSEINNARLVGKLIRKSGVLKSGSRIMTIQTQDTPNNHSNHVVMYNGEKDFSIGTRLFVKGHIHSFKDEAQPAKTSPNIRVWAHNIFILERQNDESSASDSSSDLEANETSLADRNFAELAGNVATNIVDKESVSFFNLATHYPEKRTKSSAESGNSKPLFHKIILLNKNVRDFATKNLKKGDRIFLEGKIDTRTHTDKYGKKTYSGYVIANNIERIAPRKGNTAKKQNTPAKKETSIETKNVVVDETEIKNVVQENEAKGD